MATTHTLGKISVALLIGVTITFFIISNGVEESFNREKTHSTSTNTVTVVSINPVLSTSMATSSISALAKPTKIIETGLMGTPEEESEIKKWCSVRGAICAIDEKDNQIYETYDTTTLEAMAKNSDIRAMHHLADRYATEYIAKGQTEKGFELQNQMFIKSATYGSTYGLNRLSLAASSGSLFYPKKTDRTSALEALAYIEVAAIRGDKFEKVISTKDIINSHNLVITEEDHAYINKRTNEIYQSLQAKRHELGLGDFDNNVPDAVNRYFSRMDLIVNSD